MAQLVDTVAQKNIHEEDWATTGGCQPDAVTELLPKPLYFLTLKTKATTN